MTDIDQLIKEKGGIRLDIGGGNNPNPGCVNIDILPLEKVDIVHNIELTPWPLPDNCVLQSFASHLFEHINPSPPDPRVEPLVRLLIEKNIFTEEEAHNHRLLGNSSATFMRVLDEVWRITKPGGQLAFVVPYAESHGMYQDPTHCNFINETTMAYFDPLDPSGLYQFYKPKPWKIEKQYVQRTGLLEVLLSKREEIPEYKSPRRAQDIIDEQAMPKHEIKEMRVK